MKGISRARLRRYRLAMPSALVGLVAFSFTLLIAGFSVYTATLPTMLATAQQAAEEDRVAEEQTAEQQAASQQAADAEAALSAEAGTGAAAGSSLAGASLAGLSGLSGSALSGAALSGAALSGQAATTSAATTGAATTAATTQTPDDSTIPSEAPEATSPATPDPEMEEAFHSFLLEKRGLVPGYVDEVNACVAAFNADALNPDINVRLADQRAANALLQRIVSDFSEVLNYVPVAQGSVWSNARGRLTNSYRCLSWYLGCYCDAWELNLGHGNDDPSLHVDEFMSPINTKAQGYLDEFESSFAEVLL